MAILNTLLGDEDFRRLDESQVRILEAKLTTALITDKDVHKAIESAIEPGKIAKKNWH
jgi:hypothetical protein